MANLLKIGLLGAGGFLVYKYFASSPAAPAAVAPASSSASPSSPGFNSLDAIYSRLAAAVGSTPYKVDEFNFYLQRELPAGRPAPDPDGFMPAGYNRDATMTLSQYWGAITPALKSQLGLSGLGIFGGLGALTRGWAR